MTKKLILVLLTVAGLACGRYLIDKEPHVGPGQGDGSVPEGDGSVHPHLDGGHPGGDVGPKLLPDAGFPKACNTDVRNVVLSPLDMLVVLDVSGSMDYDQKWSSVKSALKSFVANHEFDGLGVGLQYFPLRAQCSVAAYQQAAVPIGVLRGTPDVAPIIEQSLDLQQMAGGTPTVQMLEGTTAYLKDWLTQNPTHKAVLVMATDGVPDSTCATMTTGLQNNLANVLTVAQAAASADPPVHTFVIGVGKDLTALDGIAKAGGTDKAILVDTQSDADLAFLSAITQIRRNALGCEFDVPKDSIGSEGYIDPTNAQVRFTPDDKTPTLYFNNVGDRSGCAAEEGWYFDDPVHPTKLILCDETCTTVTQGKTGKLDVEFACKYIPT